MPRKSPGFLKKGKSCTSLSAVWRCNICNRQDELFEDLVQLTGARTEYKETLRIYPGDAIAHYNIACVHALQGRKQEAIAALKRAFQLQPEYR